MVHEEPRNALGVAALEAQGYEVDHLRLPVGHRHDGVMSPCGECQSCYKVHAHLLPPSHRGFSLVELRRWSLPADLRSLADWTGHTLQRSSTSLAMLVHQNRCLSTASVLCTPTCPARGAEWHSRSALSLNDGGLAGSTSWYRPSAMRQSRLPTLLKSLRVPSSVSFCHCWHSTSSC